MYQDRWPVSLWWTLHHTGRQRVSLCWPNTKPDDSCKDVFNHVNITAGRETSQKSRAKVDEEEIAVCRHGILLQGLNHNRGENYACPLFLQKEQIRHSFVWTWLAGSHNHCLTITLSFLLVWPLLLSSYCMGSQSSVTLVRPHSYCGDESFIRCMKLKTIQIPTFSVQVLLCVLPIMHLKCCGGFPITDIGHTWKKWQRSCLSSLTEMKPFLSATHAKAHTGKLNVCVTRLFLSLLRLYLLLN